MDRRTFVQSLAVAAAGLGGCAGGGSDGDGGGETPTDTALERATVLDTAFEVVDTGPGGQVDEAAVTVAGGDRQVVVDGTIWGSDGCATAALADATYDPETDELTVAVVETEREDAGDVCTQAIVEVTYRAVVSFDPDGPLPGTVVVTHDHGDGPKTVAREDATE